MVIDSSAVVAIALAESHAPSLMAAIHAADRRLISTATLVESTLVLIGHFGPEGDRELDRIIRTISGTVEPVTERQATIARDAALRFGRGRHRAALNFGDCFSYALSIESGEPLLFVGSDFSQTDVEVVPWQA